LASGLALSGYLHWQNHVGLRVAPQIHYHWQGKRGWQLGTILDAGYLARLYQGRTCEVSPTGAVARQALAGQHAFTYGAYLHLGKMLRPPWQLFLRLGAFWEYPFQQYALLHPSLVIGLRNTFRA